MQFYYRHKSVVENPLFEKYFANDILDKNNTIPIALKGRYGFVLH